ncbi:MAG: polysaccharide pyruvyl transferase family protein, partial [Oscillospiraceae bacterium]
ILEYSHLLKSFSHLSVRENEGAKIISDLTGTNCETVLDPTLLLSADKWLTLTKEKTEKKPYILIYLMSKSEKLIDFAYKLSIKTGMKVIYISNSLLKVKNFEIKRFSGPEDFLALFKNADFVVTNSFHGIAFSINFNKNFYVDFLPPPAKVNSRIENILSIFNLKDRLVINGEINGSEQIDFNKVNEILEIERRKSLEYIKEIVGYD